MKAASFSIHQANYKLQSHQTNNDNVLSDEDSKHWRKQGLIIYQTRLCLKELE